MPKKGKAIVIQKANIKLIYVIKLSPYNNFNLMHIFLNISLKKIVGKKIHIKINHNISVIFLKHSLSIDQIFTLVIYLSI